MDVIHRAELFQIEQLKKDSLSVARPDIANREGILTKNDRIAK